MTNETPDWDPEILRPFAERMDLYDDLRQRCPVALSKDGRTGRRVWSLMRHADIQSAVRDTDRFSNGKRLRLDGRRPPLESDPPEHTRFRRILQSFFTPKRMEAFRPVSEALADDLLATVHASGGGDLAVEVARPLPAQVLLTLLGQPKEDWEAIKSWSDDLRPQSLDDDAQTAVRASDANLWSYSRAVIADRQASPRPIDSDPVSALLAGGADREPLDPDLVTGTVRLLLAAGHDSTTQAIGICLHHLATTPEDQATLRADPAMIRAAVEEMLRLRTPIVAMPRIVAQDTDLGGRILGAGDRVMLNWASANRDPAAFDRPGECVLDRRPNPHMVFGSGIHTCIGAPLARQEIHVVLERLLAATTSFTLDGEPAIARMQHFGYTSLPVRLEAL
ncbi:cytochrome P450 [Rhodobacterales bacterium HKCCE2091]|nr:cytochrome P450 [Rhodobacterales bacterium HKCCE2091]